MFLKIYIVGSMKNATDNRTDTRMAFRQAVSFELSTMESGRFANIVEQGLGVDLCLGGMGMTTRYQLKSGDVLKLFFPVTEGETRLPVYTEVMWSRSAAGECRTGLRFLQ